MLEQKCGEGKGVSPVHSEGGKRSGGGGGTGLMCFRSRSVADIIPSQQCPSSLLLGLERATPPSEARPSVRSTLVR